MKSISTNVYVRLVSIDDDYTEVLVNHDLRKAVMHMTGKNNRLLPLDSSSLIRKWRRHTYKCTLTEKFHLYLMKSMTLQEMFTLRSQYLPIKSFNLSWLLFDFENPTAHRLVIQMLMQKRKTVITLGVSGVTLGLFVEYLQTRYLPYEKLIDAMDYVWELVFLSDYFGLERLFELVSGFLTVALHKYSKEMDCDDYFYCFLYSLMFRMPSLRLYDCEAACCHLSIHTFFCLY